MLTFLLDFLNDCWEYISKEDYTMILNIFRNLNCVSCLLPYDRYIYERQCSGSQDEFRDIRLTEMGINRKDNYNFLTRLLEF